MRSLGVAVLLPAVLLWLFAGVWVVSVAGEVGVLLKALAAVLWLALPPLFLRLIKGLS